ncbi:MAG: HD domain-containing protein [Candidatus Omnitrophica bacterium]|nr:HD domain-containing protein [Candidatus Omnitrophota bacterium]
MTDEKKNINAYHKELFARLRKSVDLKKEEECIGCIIRPAAWWIIEKASPRPADIKKQLVCGCSQHKDVLSKNPKSCIKSISVAIYKSRETKTLTRFDCIHGLHGFVHPVTHGDKVYGYIGTCYRHKEVSPQILNVFAAFTDTIVREVQKELELSNLYETIRPRAIALSTVHTVHRLISSTLDLNELLPRIARLSLQIMRANRCSIKLVDSKRKILLPKATVDLRKKTVTLKKVKIGRHAPGKAFKYGRPFRGRDYLSTPLIDEDTIGVITVYDKIDKKPFTSFDQEIMATMAEQAVIAIKNAQLYKEQERLTIGSIKSLAKVLDTRAPGTYVPRAAFLKVALAMGQEMRLDAESMKSLEYAAILHDAGEIVVPYEVLTKPTKLTGKEFEIVKGHPMAGVELIKHMKAMKNVTPIIMYHHENYDGSGYPKGLKREQIPIGARIMAVVSAFEAMITKRPYRTIKKVADAIEEIKKHSGTQFDPKVVNSFLVVMNRKDVKQALEKELYGHR